MPANTAEKAGGDVPRVETDGDSVTVVVSEDAAAPVSDWIDHDGPDCYWCGGAGERHDLRRGWHECPHCDGTGVHSE